jgi:hypothetical protein
MKSTDICPDRCLLLAFEFVPSLIMFKSKLGMDFMNLYWTVLVCFSAFLKTEDR